MDVIEVENFGPAIICPYNKSHLIPAARIQWHLSKCQRQYPNAKIAVCRFNASHHIPQKKLKHHESICPDRVLIERFMYPLGDGGPATSKMEQRKAEYSMPDDASGYQQTVDENWDDMDALPYNPEEYCRNNPIIRKAMHMTRSEKRQFYADERVRITTIRAKREEEENKKK
ncbi:gametocyte-specific factor 1 homolog [Anopheles maculipalpis]|uniref:gametocyte-specific factor 1 homolog n=1 Tax=Anopheles maculipalpis TaxID=1496333 RepID=UPI002158E524|nr:gametocyte-specific factor 1 homolog [Anopheles maculipalpis]